MKKKVPFSLIALLYICAVGVSQAATFTVNIRNFAFDPAGTTIQAGDTVTWINHDPIEHSATSDAGAFNSGLLSESQSFSHTFSAAGNFPYHCTPHPEMTGTIIVQGGATPPTVSITSPVNNANFAAPGNVTIEANASSTSSAISKVEFF